MFEHVDINIGYGDLKSSYDSYGRTYCSPAGKKYPSITTILSELSADSIKEWRAKVGEEEANRISRMASSRGTEVHNLLEQYVNNEDINVNALMPHIKANFLNVQKVLDARLGKVYAQELALYSDIFELAGRVDCIAEFDGVLSVIDFKTSLKPKKEEWITSYLIQESFYAAAFYESTEVPIQQIVTIIAVDGHDTQVFIESPHKYLPQLLAARRAFKTKWGI